MRNPIIVTLTLFLFCLIHAGCTPNEVPQPTPTAPKAYTVKVTAEGPTEAELFFSPSLMLGSEWQTFKLPFEQSSEIASDQVVGIYGRSEAGNLVLSVYVDGELVKQDKTGQSAQVSLKRLSE